MNKEERWGGMFALLPDRKHNIPQDINLNERMNAHTLPCLFHVHTEKFLKGGVPHSCTENVSKVTKVTGPSKTRSLVSCAVTLVFGIKLLP